MVRVADCKLCLFYIAGYGLPWGRVGGGSGPIWLDDVWCSGGESRLVDCEHGGLGSYNCNHNKDVLIRCDND